MADWSPTQPLPEGWFDPQIAFDAKGHVNVAYLQVFSLDPIKTRIAVAERQAGAWMDVFDKASEPDNIPAEINMAVGADGTAAVCYTTISSLDPATNQVRHYVAYCPSTTHAWETPTQIVPQSAPSEYARQRCVAVADNGVAVVVTDRYDGPPGSRTGSVILTAHAPGGSWDTPQQLTPGGLDGAVRLGVNAVGDATVAWVHRYQDAPSGLRYVC